MDSALPDVRSERILLLEEGDSRVSSEHIKKIVPEASITNVKSLTELESTIEQSQFDVVVVDSQLDLNRFKQLIYELKNNEAQPSLIVVSESGDSRLITELYKHGCQRFILKDERWHDELGLSVRHLLRYRQVVEENVKIRTKLTEANILLDERNRRLDEFSATVAHDIRGPLSGIIMKLQYICDRYQGSIETRFGEVLQGALKSAERLTAIVQAMYDFAKLGTKAARMQSLALSDLVEEVIADMPFDESLDILVQIGDLPRVWGSAELLRRVFINLIGNAVKYAKKKDIKISILPGAVIERNLGAYGEIIIEDNGPGIPDDELKDIFAMFRRGTASVQEGTEGLGVGLAIVQRIVELHFGSISVQSTVGQGTRFTIALPLQKIEIVGEAKE